MTPKKKVTLKYMTKRFLFAILTAFGLSQHAYAQWSYGVEAGFIRNKFHISTNEHLQLDSHDGFKFGGVVEYTLKNHVSFESGLSFLRRGGKVHGKNLNYTAIDDIEFRSMYYLQVPLTIGYKFNLGKGFSVKPHLGYFYTVGVGGKSIVSSTDPNGLNHGVRVPTFASKTSTVPYRPCNRHTVGLNYALNLTYKVFTLKFNYDRALTQTTYYGDGEHRTFSVSAIFWIK